jgi:hypothetical protein
MQRMLSYGMSIVDLEKHNDIDEMTALLNGDNLKQNYRDVVGDNPNDIIGHKIRKQ